MSHSQSGIGWVWNIKKHTEGANKIVSEKGLVVKSIEMDSYGSFIVSALGNQLRFCKLSNTEKTLATIDAHKDVISQAKFADDGSFIATVSEDRYLKTFKFQ